MSIVNSEEIDKFLFDHRDNGCVGVKGEPVDDEGFQVNVAWRDKVTGEEIEIKYNDL